MIDLKTAPYAILALRVTTGALFLFHGLVKLFVFTPAGTAGYFESIGLPGSVSYLTTVYYTHLDVYKRQGKTGAVGQIVAGDDHPVDQSAFGQRPGPITAHVCVADAGVVRKVFGGFRTA